MQNFPRDGKSYLGEGNGVKSVLAGNLKTDLVSGLGIPGSLSTGLNLLVDLVVIRSSEDAQVAGRGDGSGVIRTGISNGSSVAGDGSLLNIITGGSTNQETILSDDSVNVGSWALEEIEESAAVEVGLLEVEVELCALGGGGREEVTQDLGLESLCNSVVELNLGIKSVDGVP